MATWRHYIPEPLVAVSCDEQQQIPSTTSTTAGSKTSATSLSIGIDVVPKQQRQEQDGFRCNSPSSIKVPSSSVPVIPAVNYGSSLKILHTISSDSMKAMKKSLSSDLDFDGSFRPSVETGEPSQIPRRNLTEAFEELYINPSDSTPKNNVDTPLVKQLVDKKGNTEVVASMISPTGVADLATPSPLSAHSNLVTPNKEEIVGKLDDHLGFRLHPSLQGELSDALIQRVSFYVIIHDINKEAMAMAANDESGYNKSAEIGEEFDPIVVAVQGYPKNQIKGTSSMVSIALIDEEQWLLEAIGSRNQEEIRAVNACPPTFPQAMGERDYENPLSSLSNGSRTQLWKPSRSWWEAKSGKNPWIEPSCHNKRWRYLWPLIHYHKFLAKCIKKLKRNGVDVKTSVTPVAVFLREEVCAVSDHLANVSLFDSDEWMACLEHFNGWAESDDAAKMKARHLVAELKLRPLSEPGDVESPLLRSQIDEQYLRAMATARAQLTGTDVSRDDSREKDSMRRRDGQHSKPKSSSLECSPSRNSISQGPRPPQTPLYGGNTAVVTPGMHPRNWHGYSHPPAWWQPGWHHTPYPYPDDGSVQSALSNDTGFTHFYMNPYHPGLVSHHSSYNDPMMYHHHQMINSSHPSSYEINSVFDGSMWDGYNPNHVTPGSWMGHHQMGYSMHAASLHETSGFPATPSRNIQDRKEDQKDDSQDKFDPHSTPFKYSPGHASMSPYWAHLQDHATLSMMGLATPQGPSVPATPHHGGNDPLQSSAENHQDDPKHALSAQPLLLRQQYYGYGYNPPSPASQFLMTPQEQANLGYSFAYGSPRRTSAQRRRATTTSNNKEVNDARNDVSEGGKTISENVTPSRPVSKQSRESPNQTDGVVS